MKSILVHVVDPCWFLTVFLIQNVPPDLAICSLILEQSLSVRALQEMLAKRVDMSEVRGKNRITCGDIRKVFFLQITEDLDDWK